MRAYDRPRGRRLRSAAGERRRCTKPEAGSRESWFHSGLRHGRAQGSAGSQRHSRVLPPPNGPPRPRSAPGPPRPGPQTAPGGSANGNAERRSGRVACRDFPRKARPTGTRSPGGAGGCRGCSGWRSLEARCSEGRSSPARRARKLGPSLRAARGQGAGGLAPGRPYRPAPGRSAGTGPRC